MNNTLHSGTKEGKNYLLPGLSLAVIVIVFVLFQIFLLSKEFYSISADEAGHVLEGFSWYRGETGLYSIWLPFQKILYGLTFHIFYDLIWVPRILNMIFGILTLFALISLSNELFRIKYLSFISGFLSSLFSGLVIFSLVPLTEIYLFFFVVISLSLLFKWIRTKKEIYLWLVAITAGLSSSTRYEAWLFSFAIYIAIFFHFYSDNKSFKKHIIKILLIGLLIFSFPLIWIYLSSVSSNQPAGFVNLVSEKYSPGEFLMEIKGNVAYQFLILNWTSLNIFGFISLIYLSRKDAGIKTFTSIFFSTIILMSIVTFITKAMPTHNPWRLASIWSILLIPFTAHWIYTFLTDDRKYFRFSGMVLFIVLIVFFYNQTMNYTEESYVKKEDFVIGKYLEDNLKFNNANSKILIEKDGWSYSSLLITSQMPDRFITDKELLKNSNSIYSIDNDSLLTSSNIEYVIKRVNLQSLANLKSLEEMKKFEHWIVYKLIN
jgi:hypothetical protein